MFWHTPLLVCAGHVSTVAAVQDKANPSSSQPATSYYVASESAEARERYVLAGESILPRKQLRKKRDV